MRKIRNIEFCRRLVFILIFIASLGYAAKPSISDDFTNRRLTTGAKIFRALLAADIHLPRKVDNDGNLRVCLLYRDNPDNAQKVASTINSRSETRIRNLPVVTEILSLESCLNNSKKRFAGIFLTQRLSEENLASLIEHINEQKMVAFSPMEGDVERGVQSGIAVEARVRPYLNTEALQNAEVQLKSFFIRVSKQYEE